MVLLALIIRITDKAFQLLGATQPRPWRCDSEVLLKATYITRTIKKWYDTKRPFKLLSVSFSGCYVTYFRLIHGDFSSSRREVNFGSLPLIRTKNSSISCSDTASSQMEESRWLRRSVETEQWVSEDVARSLMSHSSMALSCPALALSLSLLCNASCGRASLLNVQKTHICWNLYIVDWMVFYTKSLLDCTM